MTITWAQVFLVFKCISILVPDHLKDMHMVILRKVKRRSSRLYDDFLFCKYLQNVTFIKVKLLFHILDQRYGMSYHIR